MDLERRIAVLEAREEIRTIVDRQNMLVDGGSSDLTLMRRHMAPEYKVTVLQGEDLFGETVSDQSRAPGTEGEAWMKDTLAKTGFWHFLGPSQIDVDLDEDTAVSNTYVLEIIQRPEAAEPQMFAGTWECSWRRENGRWLQTETVMTVVSSVRQAAGWTWHNRRTP